MRMKNIFLVFAFFVASAFTVSDTFATAESTPPPETLTRDDITRIKDMDDAQANNLSEEDQRALASRGGTEDAKGTEELNDAGLSADEIASVTNVASVVAGMAVKDPERERQIRAVISTASGTYMLRKTNDKFLGGATLAKGVAGLLLEAEAAQKVGGAIDIAIGSKLIKANCFSTPVGAALCAQGIFQVASGIEQLKKAKETEKKRKDLGGGETTGEGEQIADEDDSSNPCFSRPFNRAACCPQHSDYPCCRNPDQPFCGNADPSQNSCDERPFSREPCCSQNSHYPCCHNPSLSFCGDTSSSREACLARPFSRSPCCDRYPDYVCCDNPEHPDCRGNSFSREICDERPFDANACCSVYPTYKCCRDSSQPSCVQAQSDIDCRDPENARHSRCLLPDDQATNSDDQEFFSFCEENPDSSTCTDIVEELNDLCETYPTSCPPLSRSEPIVLANGKTVEPPFDSESFREAGLSDGEINQAKNQLNNFRKNQIRKNLPEIMDELSEAMGDDLTAGLGNPTLTSGGSGGGSSRRGRFGRGKNNDISRSLSSLMNRYNKSKKKSKSPSVQTQSLGESPLGSAQENIFEMMSKGYASQDSKHQLSQSP